MSLALVDPGVTTAKFKEELEQWKSQPIHRDHGWVLLREDFSVPCVELACMTRIAISTGSGPVPLVTCCVRLTYENYDLWPPSLTFIDLFTGQPNRPHVRAVMQTTEGPRDVLVDGHPTTLQPFVCLPGLREYHWHPQHSGDDWLLHRTGKEGSITTICDRLWRTMVKNVIGLNLQMQAMPVWPLRANLVVALGQGELQGAIPVVDVPHSPK